MSKIFRVAIVVGLALSFSLQAQILVSQVYGGGGNSGATFKNDFVELFNAGTSSVALDGWTVQYASSTGTNWQVTPLTGILAPGQYYLISESAGSGGTLPLPAPDAVGSISLSATSGKIALVNTSVALTGACPLGAAVIDFVGFGNAANCALGSVTSTLSNTTAALRNGNGCANTGNNGSDFSVDSPNPRNTANAFNQCSAGAGVTIGPATLPAATVNSPYFVALTASGGVAPYTFGVSGNFPSAISLTAQGELSGTFTTISGSPYSFTINVTDARGTTSSVLYSLRVDATAVCNSTNTIAEVQGTSGTSPLNGKVVTINGIVTATTGSGFFVQMPGSGDSNPNTSDGIYIYTGNRPTAITQPGNQVCVIGPVNEYAPSSDLYSPTNTEIDTPSSVTLISSNNPVPLPVLLNVGDTDPQGAVDQLEKYEGMRVAVDSLKVTAPTGGTVNEANATSASDGNFYGVLLGVARPFREPGIQLPDPLPTNSPCCVVRWDGNPEIISVDSSQLARNLEVTTGATVTHLVGPLNYVNRTYTVVVEPASAATVTGNVSTTPVPLADNSQLTVSAFNLERFYNSTGPDAGTSHPTLTNSAYANRLNKASLAIRNILRTPDILAVEEVQNLATLQDLANKINADVAGTGQQSPNYQPYLQLGNDISGINSGFLVKPSKITVSSVVQYGKSTTYRTPAGSQATLNDRPPLVLSATAKREDSDTGLPIIVVVNHLRSLLDLNNPSNGPTVRAKREAQAEYLAGLIQSFQTSNPNANIVSVGDYNAYQFSDGYVDTVGVIKGTPALTDQVVLSGPRLVSPTLTNLIDTELISNDQRYSYTFNGSAQAIDQIVVNDNLLVRATKLVFGRVDADFPETLRNDATRPERVSDHDPAEAFFTLPFGVTNKVQISGSGFAYSRVTQTYTGTLTLTNTSNSTLPGPLYLQFSNLPTGVTLANGTGSGYITTANIGLGAGQSVTVQVQFNNPSNARITYSPTIYAGSM